MIKTIAFGEKNVKFCTSFAWVFVYKNQFGHDPVKILMPAIQKMSVLFEDETANEMEQAVALYEELGFNGIAQIAWAMAKLCDRTMPEPLEWIMTFGDDFEPLTIMIELIPEVITSCFASKNPQTPEMTTGEKMNEN